MSEDLFGMTKSAIPPAYEVYCEARQSIGLSSDAKHLKYALQGPLNSAIEVMHDTNYNPNIPTEAYGDQTASTTIWHPISRSPLTDPDVSSIVVHIESVEDWESQWLEFHRFCHHPDENEEDPNKFLFRDLPDHDPDSDEEDELHLLRCCRANRLRKKGKTLLPTNHKRVRSTDTCKIRLNQPP